MTSRKDKFIAEFNQILTECIDYKSIKTLSELRNIKKMTMGNYCNYLIASGFLQAVKVKDKSNGLWFKEYISLKQPFTLNDLENYSVRQYMLSTKSNKPIKFKEEVEANPYARNFTFESLAERHLETARLARKEIAAAWGKRKVNIGTSFALI